MLCQERLVIGYKRFDFLFESRTEPLAPHPLMHPVQSQAIIQIMKFRPGQNDPQPQFIIVGVPKLRVEQSSPLSSRNRRLAITVLPLMGCRSTGFSGGREERIASKLPESAVDRPANIRVVIEWNDYSYDRNPERPPVTFPKG